jgi:hypothetical protein
MGVLMVPPERLDFQHKFDPTAPFSEWKKYPEENPRIYASRAECEADIVREGATVGQLNPSWGDMFKHARCVPAEEPISR